MKLTNLFGRSEIFSDVTEINAGNVIDVLRDALPVHEKNRTQIDYLFKYYKGEQPILGRKKKVRPEICNKVVENRANEIVAFKVGYLCGEPIQYISRSTDETVAQAIGTLNDIMLADSKAAKDKALVEWQAICGTAYRMPLVKGEEDAPFELVTLEPNRTFLIKSSRIGHRILGGVFCITDSKGAVTYCVYTDRDYFEVNSNEIVKHEKHALGRVPIVEYPANNARLGAFEIVLPLLDAINTVASNRLDGVEQFVQSLMKFVNCEVDKETLAELMELGAVQIKSRDGQNADVQIMTQELNQGQTQTLVDYMYQTVLTICGMPNRNGGGSSTSDTGAASLLRDGWTLAEARAKDNELMFKQSEQEMLRVVLPLCMSFAGIDLKLRDIDIKFTRRNYENIQTKAQVLCEMLNNSKIDPKLAFTHCGLFTDPEEAYMASMEWYKGQQKELTRSLKEAMTHGTDEPVQTDGQGNGVA